MWIILGIVAVLIWMLATGKRKLISQIGTAIILLVVLGVVFVIGGIVVGSGL